MTRVLGSFARHFAFDTFGHAIRVSLAVCLLVTLAAVLLGQDANWDLRNYHLYNGWAALHGRLSLDLAPAQLQSYFVPWLDVGYYLLAIKGSPMLASVVLGLLHGLAFAAVAAVTWLTLEGDSRRVWLAPLLALAGCCSVAFLSELGNVMGDNTTAPLILGALALALYAARTDTAHNWLLAGLLLGLALAFKLTNAPYALGLGAVTLVAQGRWMRRLRGAALMTLSAILMFTLVAGPWFYRVGERFGNPLLPMFNQWFHSPLALPLPNSDTSFLPQSVGQALAWPLLITINPNRIGQIGLYQLVWSALYLLGILTIARAILRRVGRNWVGLPPPNGQMAHMLSAFVAVSFLAWLVMFSIHRYLVALELVAPLALWLLARYALPAVSAEKWAIRLVVTCAIIGCVATRTWGHEGWAQHGFVVDAPHIEQPEKSTVMIVGEEPQAWRIPFLPDQASYIGIATNFPSSTGYDERVQKITSDRGGMVYALFPGAQENVSCRCAFRKADDQNGALIANAETQLHAHGWQLNRASCTVHASTIGAGNYPFHWCEAARLP